MIDCKKDKRQVLRVAHRYKLLEPAYLMPFHETQALAFGDIMSASQNVLDRGKLPIGTELYVLNVACAKKHGRLWYKVKIGEEDGWFNSASLVCEEII